MSTNPNEATNYVKSCAKSKSLKSVQALQKLRFCMVYMYSLSHLIYDASEN